MVILYDGEDTVRWNDEYWMNIVLRKLERVKGRMSVDGLFALVRDKLQYPKFVQLLRMMEADKVIRIIGRSKRSDSVMVLLMEQEDGQD